MLGAGRLVRGSLVGFCLLGGLAWGISAHITGAGAQATALTAARIVPSRATGSLGLLVNIPQTWNNCGPASIAEVLAYWSIYRTQGEVQAVLRVDGLERGMAPFGVPAYARSLGMRALVGVGGTAALVKALVSNGLPVIVSQQVSVSNRIGHYRPIEAYDDRQGVFVASDPYLGQGHVISYGDFARIWARSGSGFIVLYPPSRQALVSAVLASVGWDRTRAYRADLARLRARLRERQPQFSVGGSPLPSIAGYRYLGLAWDEAQLGLSGPARADLQQATRQGANPIEIGWIAAQIAH